MNEKKIFRTLLALRMKSVFICVHPWLKLVFANQAPTSSEARPAYARLGKAF
jgi:hypothetical protein